MDGAAYDASALYWQKKLYMGIALLVLIGGLNWLTEGVLGRDVLSMLMRRKYVRWVYIAVGIAALSLLFSRDFYLPFLGETLVPGTLLTARTPQGANDQVRIQVAPGAKVLYWATEPNPTAGKEIQVWSAAYGAYENSGVVMADEKGEAVLRIRGPPQPYTVPCMFGLMKKRLEPHVHFRVSEPSGFLGRVKTVFLEDGRVEGFSDMV
jgi:uncharacterized membrane protein YuzA (DUF378 family)